MSRLKIKDSVDLSELGKFGFVLDKSGIYYEKQFEASGFDEGYSHTISIYVENRRMIALDIMNNDYTYHSFCEELGGIEETLFDLI